MKLHRPRLWLVAGPNGSGKSTAYGRGDVAGFDGSVWIINPDLLTVRIHDAEGVELDKANLEAVKRIESWLGASIAAHQTIGVETVLSTGKYRTHVERAKVIGFQICFIYVFLDTAELQIERIKARVAKGGHHVPDDKVIGRRERSFNQMPWFFWNSDSAWIFNNSRSEPRLAGRLEQGGATLDESAIPADLFSAIVNWQTTT